MDKQTWFTRDYYDECFGLFDEDGDLANLFDAEPEKVQMLPEQVDYLTIPKIQAFSHENAAEEYLFRRIHDFYAGDDLKDRLSQWHIELLTENFLAELPMVYEVVIEDS